MVCLTLNKCLGAQRFLGYLALTLGYLLLIYGSSDFYARVMRTAYTSHPPYAPSVGLLVRSLPSRTPRSLF